MVLTNVRTALVDFVVFWIFCRFTIFGESGDTNICWTVAITNVGTTLFDCVVFFGFFCRLTIFGESGIQIYAERNTFGPNSSVKTQNGPDTG